jgi:hypothetical protein
MVKLGSSSDVGVETGVATVLDDDELLPEHARVFGESNPVGIVLDEEGDAEKGGENPGVLSKCSTPVRLCCIRFGRGAIFLRSGKFPSTGAHGVEGTNVASFDCSRGDLKA